MFDCVFNCQRSIRVISPSFSSLIRHSSRIDKLNTIGFR